MRLAFTLLFQFLACTALAQIERTVTFRNNENILSGTLTLPKQEGVYPGIVIALGTGSQNRDCETEGLRPFKLIAAELARKGFIVLRYDNRSRGFSKGKPIDESTTPELATDAQAAFNYLKSQRYVDKNRIGFIGHSEGTTIATIAASVNPEIKFLVLINGTILTGYEDILLNTRQRLQKKGISDKAINECLQNLKLLLGKPTSTSKEQKKAAARRLIRFEVAQLPAKDKSHITARDIEQSVDSQIREVSSTWEKHYLILNPAVYYRQVKCPVTLLFSDSELEGVLIKKLALFKEVLTKDPQLNKIRIVKNADHNLISTKSSPTKGTKSVSTHFIRTLVEEVQKYR